MTLILDKLFTSGQRLSEILIDPKSTLLHVEELNSHVVDYQKSVWVLDHVYMPTIRKAFLLLFIQQL